jgi:hypothetical protein
MKFRPGARSVRMCLGIVVTVVSAAGCAPVPDQATHTVEYYGSHAQERQAMLDRCANNPGELAQKPDCVNARAAARQTGVGSLQELPPLQLPASTPNDSPAVTHPLSGLRGGDKLVPHRGKED